MTTTITTQHDSHWWSHVVQNKNSRLFWIISIAEVLLILAALAASGDFLYASYVNRSTPEKTLDSFCHAIQHGDALQAYNQYTQSYQHSHSEQQFASIITANPLTACAHGPVSLSGQKASTSLKLTYGSGATNNDAITLRQDSQSNNTWKIANGIQFFTPEQILATFCKALQRSDYRTAHAQFTDTYQSAYPAQQFASDLSLDKLTSCTYTPVGVSGTSGLTTLFLAHASGVTNSDLILLSQNRNNTWKIASGIKLSTPFMTLNAFCHAIQHGDYQTAYNQFSDDFQSTISEPAFVGYLSPSAVSSCTYSSLTIFSTTATAILHLSLAYGAAFTDDVTLTQDSNNDWKITTVRLR